MAFKRTGTAGKYLLLKNLVAVLPSDYHITLKYNGEVKWQGVAWVFMYDKVYIRFADYGVVSFDTDYYNEKIVMRINIKA